MDNFYSELSVFLTQHWWLALGFLAVAAAWIVMEIQFNFVGIPRLVPSEAILLINRESPIILDVRDFTHFDQGHISNALNIPLVDLPQGNGKLSQNKDRKILLVCEQGLQSNKAVHILKKQGFNNLFILKGGVQAWRSENLPLIKGIK